MGKIKFNQAQLEIIKHRAGNMIVSASAGSGKTTVMLERVLRIIEEGTPIDRIVILAFNNSIAAEIRGKMYKKMLERLQDSECTQKEFIKQQIDRLPFCNIITNDSYCNRTSSEFFQILGINPKADILGELEKNILFKKSFYKSLGELKEEENGEIFELSLKFGGDARLLSQVQIVHNYVSVQADGMRWLDKVVSGVYTEDISKSSIMSFMFDIVEKRLNYAIATTKQIIALVGENIRVIKSKKTERPLKEPYINYLDVLNSLKDIKTYQEFYEKLKYFSLADKEKKTKEIDIDWDTFKKLHDNLKSQVEYLKSLFQADISEIQEVHSKTKKDIELLVKLYKMTRAYYVQAKTQEGKFDFSDFPDNVIKLLNNPDIRQEIAQRYDYICVDEYQDTNYVQEEIYTKISNGNNLFMVGDSKQSIYRFRLSEPRILLEKFEDYNQNVNHGKTKKLDFNYRSDKGIVEFANAIFDEIMTKDFGGVDYKQTDKLQYGADYAIQPTKPTYEIHLFEEPEKEKQEHKTFENVYSVRDDIVIEGEPSTAYREGQFIADKIEEIVNNYKIYDPTIKDLREVKYSDIALLARTGQNKVREVVKAIQDRLIPIDVAPLLKVEGIYEIEIIKDILRLISNDMQDLALAAVLVSYWVGMDYDDLLDIRQKQQNTEFFWQAVKAEKDNNPYIRKFYQMLEDLRFKASYMSIKQVAESIVFDYGFDMHVLTLDGGEYKLSALKTYLETLNELSAGCSLSEYVATLDSGKMEIKGGADGNMVKAMTIHKSKGLEFPIVFICNIDDTLINTNGLNMPKLHVDKEVGIAIHYFNKQTMTTQKNLVFDILSERNKMQDKAEAMRLFYVALTRPKNHVFLTGKLKKNTFVAKNPFDVDSFLDWVVVVAENNQKVFNAITTHQIESAIPPIMTRYSYKKYQGDKIPIVDKYLDFQYPYKKAQETSIKYTVTEINKQGGKKQSFLTEEEISVEEMSQETDKAKRGTSYHTVLEHIDINATSLNEVQKEIEKMLQNNLISKEEFLQIDINEIVAVMNSNIMQYARQNKFYREKEFTLTLPANEIFGGQVEDKIFVQGTIDLLIIGEQVWVVDYKKSSEKSEVLKQRYAEQLKLYCLAVERAIGRKVDKAVLLVLGSMEEVQINL